MLRLTRITIAIMLIMGSAAWASTAAFVKIAEGQSTSGPPYPTIQPTVVKVYDKASPLLADALLEEVTLNYTMTPPELVADFGASDSGGSTDVAGTTAAFNYYLDALSPAPPAGISLSIPMQLNIPGSSGNTISSSSPVWGDSFFDIFFDVESSSGVIVSHHLHGELGVGEEPLPLDNLSYDHITWEYIPTDAYDVFLKIDMNTGAVTTPGVPVPLMNMEMTASYVPEPAATSLLVAGALLGWLRRKRS